MLLKNAFGLSLGLHAVALATLSIGVEPAQFDVDRGHATFEVAFFPPAPPRPQPLPQISLSLQEPAAIPIAQPPIPPERRQPPQPESAATPPGAMTETLPGYLRNPAPVYPALARQRGYEGTVLVEAVVSHAGRCEGTRVISSSGHALLDDAAVKAVQQWVFKPARRGRHAVALAVEIPITFRLVEPPG